MPAHHSREPAHALGHDRIALVRLRRASLLLLAEGLECLPTLAALQMSYVCRDPLQRCSRKRESGHEVRVAVPSDHLSGDRIRFQPKLGAHIVLDSRVDRRMRADGATDAAYRNLVAGLVEPRQRSIELRDPPGHLEAEGDGLRDHAVSAPGHEGPAMSDG